LQRLTFQSENARNVYEANAQRALEDESNVSSASLGIPFIVGLEHSKRISAAAVRNDVATALDINGDQHISDYEASLHEGRQ